MDAMSPERMLSKEIARPVNNAGVVFSSKPYAIKSTPSWTITQIIQDVVSAK
jgi:hypothetical protein